MFEGRGYLIRCRYNLVSTDVYIQMPDWIKWIRKFLRQSKQLSKPRALKRMACMFSRAKPLSIHIVGRSSVSFVIV